MTLPLAGLLVVGVEQAISAPMCTRQLVDLGARVIKIEPPAGDFTRDYDDAVHGTSCHFAWANRGKESVVLDVKSEPGQAALFALLERADVLVHNLAPGAAERLGIAGSQLRPRFPRLIVAAISGYGVGGPFGEYRAYDLLVQSEAGSCAVTGTADQPAKPGIPVADIGSGMQAAQAILAALLQRERTGEGSSLSIGMFDVVADWLGWAMNQSRYTGVDLVPNGVSSPLLAPYGAYRTKDGQTLVLGTSNDREWQRLASAVLGRPELATDPRYATNLDRVSRRAELDELIGAWAAKVTLAAGRDAAQAAGLGHAKLNRPSEVLEHPQLTERDRWRPVPCAGDTVLSLLPAAESDSWEPELLGVPDLGEHTAAVLAELGLG